MDRRRKFVHAVFFGSALACAVSCVSVPPFDPAGPSDLAPDERRLWNRAREEADRLDRSPIVHPSAELSAYVNDVLGRLLATGRAVGPFTPAARIIKNPLLNAFALPHGAIYLHSGLLAKIENEAQLAAIPAHELTHITHRHALHNFRGIQRTTAALAAVQIAISPLGASGAIGRLLGSLGATAALSGYSRSLESEADQNGFELLTAAGYDPAEAPRLFDFLKGELEERKVDEPFFFGSHPRLEERKENWTRLLRERSVDPAGDRGVERYRDAVGSVLLESAELDLARAAGTGPSRPSGAIARSARIRRTDTS